MQDLSQVAGQVIANIDGHDVMLSGYTFEDLGTLQGEVLRDKRRSKLQVALELKSLLPGEEGEREFDKACAAAEKLTLADKDVEAYLQTTTGVSTLLWILVERQHPRQFTRAQILKSIVADQLPEEKILELMESLKALQQKKQ